VIYSKYIPSVTNRQTAATKVAVAGSRRKTVTHIDRLSGSHGADGRDVMFPGPIARIDIPIAPLL